MVRLLHKLCLLVGAAGGAWGTVRLLERWTEMRFDFSELGPSVFWVVIVAGIGAGLAAMLTGMLLPTPREVEARLERLAERRRRPGPLPARLERPEAVRARSARF